MTVSIFTRSAAANAWQNAQIKPDRKSLEPFPKIWSGTIIKNECVVLMKPC